MHNNQRLLSFLFRFSTELSIRSIISDDFNGTITGQINMGNGTNVYTKYNHEKIRSLLFNVQNQKPSANYLFG